jgi:hypothetical protein
MSEDCIEYNNTEEKLELEDLLKDIEVKLNGHNHEIACQELAQIWETYQDVFLNDSTLHDYYTELQDYCYKTPEEKLEDLLKDIQTKLNGDNHEIACQELAQIWETHQDVFLNDSTLSNYYRELQNHCNT